MESHWERHIRYQFLASACTGTHIHIYYPHICTHTVTCNTHIYTLQLHSCTQPWGCYQATQTQSPLQSPPSHLAQLYIALTDRQEGAPLWPYFPQTPGQLEAGGEWISVGQLFESTQFNCLSIRDLRPFLKDKYSPSDSALTLRFLSIDDCRRKGFICWLWAVTSLRLPLDFSDWQLQFRPMFIAAD